MQSIAFIGVVLIGFLLPFWVSVIAALAYALWKPGYELILLGALIDALFSAALVDLPFVYTLTFAGIVLAANMLKPHLTIYNG